MCIKGFVGPALRRSNRNKVDRARKSGKRVYAIIANIARTLPYEYDVGPARVFLGEAEKTPWHTMCGLGPASRVNKNEAAPKLRKSFGTQSSFTLYTKL